MNTFEVIHVHSAHEFIDLMRRSHELWRGRSDTETDWIFRGQLNQQWHLEPSAHRQNPQTVLIHTYCEFLAKKYAAVNWEQWAAPEIELPPAKWKLPLRDVALEALVHATLVRDFVLLADDVRHPIKVLPFFRDLLDPDTRAFHHYFNGHLGDEELEIFAIAQHHGVPTLLLDWSFDPLVAAYFAAEGIVNEAAENDSENDLSVWALRRSLFEAKTPWPLAHLTVRGGLTPFVDAQAALFTWSPRIYLLELAHGKLPRFDAIVRGLAFNPDFAEWQRPFLRKVILPRAEALPLLKLLWRERLTSAHLMPTFDNIARALRLRSRWLPEGAGLI
jgi:hypothetical protein